MKITQALISVSDKTGLLPLCAALRDAGVLLFSTGGTKKFLEDSGFSVVGVESVTQFPEMLDGRVKTLHPKVFGGILARRGDAGHARSVAEHGIPLFDLVVVNLYPFGEHRNLSVEEQVNWVDIGGPSLLRAAAKNFEGVAVLCDPNDYPHFLEDAGATLTPSLSWRRRAAAKVFRHTSAYDSMIAESWSEGDAAFPQQLAFTRHIPLRYGENPHQRAAWLSSQSSTPWAVLQGKELSYNNLLDADAAHGLVNRFQGCATVVVKHATPCGVASAKTPSQSVARALFADPVSAFGGILATNCTFDSACAEACAGVFLEVIVAPKFDEGARSILAVKKNLRLVEWENPSFASWEYRSAFGGTLIQQPDPGGPDASMWQWVTECRPTPEQVRDLEFAWRVGAWVKSNAIVIAADQATLGVGGGQPNRVGALEIALRSAWSKAPAAVLASDAFFPFRDSIDSLAKARSEGAVSIQAIVQPGGSVRDAEVIAACNEHKIAMGFSGVRHFRH